MSNKILIIVLVIVVLAGAGFFTWQYWPKEKPVANGNCGNNVCDSGEDAGNCPNDCKEQSITKEQIARKLMKDYFNLAKSSSVPPERRLVDYRIDEIGGIREENENKCFRFGVSYSVLPETGDYWMAGDGGIKQSDGWITGKGAFVDAIEKNGVYVIREMGTAAGSISCTGVDK